MTKTAGRLLVGLMVVGAAVMTGIPAAAQADVPAPPVPAALLPPVAPPAPTLPAATTPPGQTATSGPSDNSAAGNSTPPAGPAPAEMGLPGLNIQLGRADNPREVSTTLQLVLMLTVLSLAPAILMLMTAFTRIVVVLSFLRNALATPAMPPNQVLMGLALFLTYFVMQPTLAEVNTRAIQPYLSGALPSSQAVMAASEPLRDFMVGRTREKDLALFLQLAKAPEPQSEADVPMHVVIPAFVISELKTAFQIGFLIFIPFLVVDMVVATTLMSMGMLMLPPMMISLPFKILLFIVVDGWHLVVEQLLLSFG